MAISESAQSIIEALDLLGIDNNDETTTNAVVPTANTRQAIELLTYSTIDDLKDLNFKKITDNLYNWSTTPRSTKTLTKAVIEALQTPNKYKNAVSAITYTTAYAPLLEPDRIIRLLKACLQSDSCFAPMKYTLQLSSKLTKAFKNYPQERIEKLAISLWETAHTGRWWNAEYGITDNTEEPHTTYNTHEEAHEQILSDLTTYRPENEPYLKTLPYSKELHDYAKNYQKQILSETPVDPDTAINLSHLTWLPLENRPDNPINSLLTILNQYNTDYPELTPKKPKTFTELFPIELISKNTTKFPILPQIINTTTLKTPTTTITPITNIAELIDNAEHMGNCTASYKTKLQDGSQIMLIIHHEAETYNAHLAYANNRWTVKQINKRFNQGSNPQVEKILATITRTLPKLDNKAYNDIEKLKTAIAQTAKIVKKEATFKYNK